MRRNDRRDQGARVYGNRAAIVHDPMPLTAIE
jgi:hypothetical protein